MSQEYIIAYADKSVLKISGLSVKGMSTTQVEKILQDKLKAIVGKLTWDMIEGKA